MQKGAVIPPHIAKRLALDLSHDFAHYAGDTMSLIDDVEDALQELYGLRMTERGRFAYEMVEKILNQLTTIHQLQKARSGEFDRYYRGVEKYKPQMHGTWAPEFEEEEVEVEE